LKLVLVLLLLGRERVASVVAVAAAAVGCMQGDDCNRS
jgi:hypothetical protein